MMNKVDNCQVQVHSLIQEQFSQIQEYFVKSTIYKSWNM